MMFIHDVYKTYTTVTHTHTHTHTYYMVYAIFSADMF
jgi:hypothetical protein